MRVKRRNKYDEKALQQIDLKPKELYTFYMLNTLNTLP